MSTGLPPEFDILFGSWSKSSESKNYTQKPSNPREHRKCKKCGCKMTDHEWAFYCNNKDCEHWGVLTLGVL